MVVGLEESAFCFERVGLQTVKGYNQPVAFYSPLLGDATATQSRWARVKPMVKQRAIFSLAEIEAAWQRVNARQLQGSKRDATLARLGRLPFEQQVMLPHCGRTHRTRNSHATTHTRRPTHGISCY